MRADGLVEVELVSADFLYEEICVQLRAIHDELAQHVGEDHGLNGDGVQILNGPIFHRHFAWRIVHYSGFIRKFSSNSER